MARNSKKFNSRRVPVINCTTGRLNPLTWDDLLVWSQDIMINQLPLAQLYREPGGKTTILRLEYRIRWIFDHWLPAYLIDFLLFVFRQRRFMVRLYGKIAKTVESLEYFVANNWDFQSRMALVFNQRMSIEDRRLFYCDVREIDWKSYIYDINVGMRKYILKEDLSTVPEGFKVQRRRRLIWAVIKTVFWICMLTTVARKTSIGENLWNMLMLTF